MPDLSGVSCKPLSQSAPILQAKGCPEGVSTSPTSIAREGVKGPSRGIPFKSEMEQAFGTDLAAVQCHTDSVANTACARLGARAFTLGNHIAFDGSSPSRGVVAHEVAHVFQQSGQSRKTGSKRSGVDTSGEPQAQAVQRAVESGQSVDSVAPDLAVHTIESREEETPALLANPASSLFTIGLEFSPDDFLTGFEYTIWDRDLFPIPIAPPFLLMSIKPFAKVRGAVGGRWSGEEGTGVQMQVEASGGITLRLFSGKQGVIELYLDGSTSLDGSGRLLRRHDNSTHLSVDLTASITGSIGLELGGGWLDLSYQLGSIDLFRLRNIVFDSGEFRPQGVTFEWGPEISAIFDNIVNIIEALWNIVDHLIGTIREHPDAISTSPLGLGHHRELHGELKDFSGLFEIMRRSRDRQQ
ncbi:MAG: DUF4157 domain-containing protein [Bradymonadales bacterium]|nr:DUF4157 domain-containing protein [Bradymonadales bacterium]